MMKHLALNRILLFGGRHFRREFRQNGFGEVAALAFRDQRPDENPLEHFRVLAVTPLFCEPR